MSDESMRERVARALALRHSELGGDPRSDPVYWLSLAAAALRALREPTAAMVAASWHACEYETPMPAEADPLGASIYRLVTELPPSDVSLAAAVVALGNVLATVIRSAPASQRFALMVMWTKRFAIELKAGADDRPAE